jgi:hypothetical protein
MKRFIVTILFFVLAICFTGCVSVTRHKEEHVNSAPAPLPGHRRPAVVRPAKPPRHRAHHEMAKRPEHEFGHPRH